MFTPKRRHTLGLDESSVFSQKGNSPYKTLNLSVNEEKESPFNKTYVRNTTFQVLEQGETHQLVTYGSNLPFEVAKVLSNAHVTSKLFDNGWAIVVNSRTLYAWRYTASSVKKLASCFELQLSPTELTHTCALTCILQNVPNEITAAVNMKTSVMNVSPEGCVRYWQNITRPAVVIESNMDLGGKICHRLLPIMPHGCILLTTTNEMFLLTPSVSSIVCRQITSTAGMLSNIGRRVSSFWSQADTTVSQFLPCICQGLVDYELQERYFYAVMKSRLQKWCIAGNQLKDCNMMFEVDVLHCLKRSNLSINWEEQSDVEVIDMKNTGYGTVLLISYACNKEKFQCCIATFKTFSSDDITVENVIPIQHEFETSELSSLQLTLPCGRYEAFISSPTTLVCHSVSRANLTPIIVDITRDNFLIGTGSCGSEAIFMLKKHGLVNLVINNIQDRRLTEPSSQKPSIIMSSTQEKEEEIDEPNFSGDVSVAIKNIFIQFTKNENILLDIKDRLNSTKDDIRHAILSISSEILDSLPATDPRWAASQQQALRTSSVLLLNQLTDKLQIFETYLRFLERSSIYDTLEDVVDDTRCDLCEHGERLQASITLLNLYNEHAALIDKVINDDELQIDTTDEGDKKDIFFAKVSSIDLFFKVLIKQEEAILTQMKTVKEQIEFIVSSSEIMTNCYTSSWRYRKNYQTVYQLSHNIKVPWTGSTDGVNNRSLLKTQINLIVEQALPNVDSVKNGSLLTQYVVLLTDILLDGYEREITIQKNKSNESEIQNKLIEEFSEARKEIILALVDLRYNEQALTLAEKYEDFPLLILICERNNDQEKLQYYKNMFQNQGFTDVLYSYYMNKGSWGKLMSTENTSPDYEKFLSVHHELSWLHYIGNQEFSKASDVLKNLAKNEQENLDRKKIMYVLANLSMLASSEMNSTIQSSVTESDKELEIIEYQAKIMKYLGHENLPPMTVDELLQLCLQSQIRSVDENMCIILLELLSYVNDDALLLGQSVWKKIIEQDSWEESSTLQYSTSLSQKLVFKCLKYFLEKDSFSSYCNSLNQLILSEDDSLSQTCRVQVKACYELLGVNDMIIETV